MLGSLKSNSKDLTRLRLLLSSYFLDLRVCYLHSSFLQSPQISSSTSETRHKVQLLLSQSVHSNQLRHHFNTNLKQILQQTACKWQAFQTNSYPSTQGARVQPSLALGSLKIVLAMSRLIKVSCELFCLLKISFLKNQRVSQNKTRDKRNSKLRNGREDGRIGEQLRMMRQ